MQAQLFAARPRVEHLCAFVDLLFETAKRAGHFGMSARARAVPSAPCPAPRPAASP